MTRIYKFKMVLLKFFLIRVDRCNQCHPWCGLGFGVKPAFVLPSWPWWFIFSETGQNQLAFIP